jgi:2-methylisocitrate lyase-like PEP mutase family enzyme
VGERVASAELTVVDMREPAVALIEVRARRAHCSYLSTTSAGRACAASGSSPALRLARVIRLKHAGAAGCNLEETDHAARTLRDPAHQAKWLSAVRQTASAEDYPLVINARVDVFLESFIAGAEPGTQIDMVPEAVERANAYVKAGADCIYPIALWEPHALKEFMAGVDAPVNVSRVPQMTSLTDVAALGVARVSWAIFLFEAAMAHFRVQLASLRT